VCIRPMGIINLVRGVGEACCVIMFTGQCWGSSRQFLHLRHGELSIMTSKAPQGVSQLQRQAAAWRIKGVSSTRHQSTPSTGSIPGPTIFSHPLSQSAASGVKGFWHSRHPAKGLTSSSTNIPAHSSQPHHHCMQVEILQQGHHHIIHSHQHQGVNPLSWQQGYGRQGAIAQQSSPMTDLSLHSPTRVL